MNSDELSIPIHLLWGLDTAIKKLRPFAAFTLIDGNITDWDDPSGSEPPTKEEIYEQMLADKNAHDDWLKRYSNLNV